MLRAAFAALASAFALSVSAQSYPVRPVRVIVPWPAGGSNDTAARIVAKAIGDSMGQPFVIDNKPGASGTIGADMVARSPADGYTLMIHSATHLANAYLYKRLPYDTLQDFAPVSLLASQPSALAVHSGIPAKTFGEFLALVKQRKGQLTYSSAGIASASHIPMAMLIAATGIDLLHVPYKGGSPQTLALVSREVDASITILSTALPHVQSGAIRLLAVTSSSRVELMPTTPTMAESGVTNFDFNPWIGLFAPAGTPRSVVDALANEVRRALELPQVRKALRDHVLEPMASTPAEFMDRLRRDSVKYEAVIKTTAAYLRD